MLARHIECRQGSKTAADQEYAEGQRQEYRIDGKISNVFCYLNRVPLHLVNLFGNSCQILSGHRVKRLAAGCMDYADQIANDVLNRLANSNHIHLCSAG